MNVASRWRLVLYSRRRLPAVHAFWPYLQQEHGMYFTPDRARHACAMHANVANLSS